MDRAAPEPLLLGSLEIRRYRLLMPIQNDAELSEVAARVNLDVQQIADYVKRNPDSSDQGKIRFPRGYLTTAGEFRVKLSFIVNDALKRNVSYALMGHDVLRWIVYHTDLSGAPKEMMIKESICLLASICESISIIPNAHGLGRRAGFRGRTDRLLEINLISRIDHERLVWLWDKRNQEHLIDVLFREFDHYTERDWCKAVAAYHGLRDGLRRWRGDLAEP